MSASKILPDDRGPMDRQSNIPDCPICGRHSFEAKRERTKGLWGITSHVKTLLVCNGCCYVLAFYDGRRLSLEFQFGA